MKCRVIQKRIADYVDGLLSPALMEKVEEHLEACDLCRGECESLRDTVRLVSQWGRFHCPVDCSPTVLQRLRAAPQRGTRFTWPSLSLALRAGFAATAAAGAAVAIIASLALRPPAPPPGPAATGRPPDVRVATVDPPEWHDANRTQQALGTTDSLVLELPSGSGTGTQQPQ